MECPVCKKEFNEATGRRPKKFCSDPCKVKFFNAKKKVVKNNEPETKNKIEGDRNGQKSETKSRQNPMTFEEMMAAAAEIVKPKTK